MKDILLKNKPVIFKNNNFQSIQIRLFFPYERNENEYALSDLLLSIIQNTSLKYPTEEDFRLQEQKLYILNSFCYNSIIGDTCYFVMNLSIPNKSILNKDLYEEQLKFFSEMIYNPKVKNKNFDFDEVEREKTNLRNRIEKINNDSESYAIMKARELVDDVGLLSGCTYNHPEQIDLINTSNLYEFYYKNIYNNQPAIYVMGDVCEDEFGKLCSKYLLKRDFHDKHIKINLNYLKPRNTISNIIENSKFKNSVIVYLYKIIDMSLNDVVTLNTVNNLLSSMSSRLLNKKLRDENDLVYSSHVILDEEYGVFGVYALINKDNEDIVREKIVEVINDLKDEKLITPLLNNIKERFRVSLIRNLDFKGCVFKNYIIEDSGIDYTDSLYYEKLKNITAKDISLFIDRLVLDTTYFLKEDYNE